MILPSGGEVNGVLSFGFSASAPEEGKRCERAVGIDREERKRDVEDEIAEAEREHDPPKGIAQESHRDGDDVVRERHRGAVDEKEDGKEPRIAFFHGKKA